MPVGDCERGVAEAAREDGISLTGMTRIPWLNTHGHFALPEEAAPVVPLLQRAFELLGGDEEEQRNKRLRPLHNDLFHKATNTMVEVDELQHFTSYRLRTMEFVKDRWSTAEFDTYNSHCASLKNRADRYRASKVGKGFPGENSRSRQRAYNDLLRDLVPHCLGMRILRIPAPGLNGVEAYRASRERVRFLLSH